MKRIQAIASLVDANSKVVDIGTDHAYLPIYLYQNNITKFITASDISKEVLKYSAKNLIKNNLEDKIELIESDGFKNLSGKYDIAIITGMGSSTIKKILSVKNLPKKIIVCSHNNIPDLRIFINSIGYKVEKEIIVKEKEIYYDIIKYTKGKENLTEEDILLGKSNNLEYLNYLLNKYKILFSKSKDLKYLKYINVIEKKLA